ncbi:hypothetical protein BWD14_19085 [Leptospira santarosai]|uniref:Uncharacterized protein n=1 Tax=Leptospira santarosai TaxID=28183 RepID=A0AB73LKG5_9LEPT|nr:hypothetical protein BWD14_19085 [Leptospira santarosai]
MKTSFGTYNYVKPKNSTLYLNEFSFIKNVRVLGLDIISEDQGLLGIGSRNYGLKKSEYWSENWLKNSIDNYTYIESSVSKNEDIISQSGYSLINSSFKLEKAKARLSKAMLAHNDFWIKSRGTYIQRKKELRHQKTALKIWNFISDPKEDNKYHSVSEVCSELRIHKIRVLLILNKWLHLKIIEKRRVDRSWYDRSIDFAIRIKAKELPYLLYTNFKKAKNKKTVRSFK